MDIEFEIMDQDQTRIELWIIFFRVYKGIIGFLFTGKTAFFCSFFACFFLVITVQFLAGFVSYLYVGWQWEGRVSIVWGSGWGGLYGDCVTCWEGVLLTGFDMAMKISSLNANGIRKKFKQYIIFTRLNKPGFDVVFLQETHVANMPEAIRFSKLWEGRIFWSFGTTRNCGVGILINKSL